MASGEEECLFARSSRAELQEVTESELVESQLTNPNLLSGQTHRITTRQIN